MEGGTENPLTPKYCNSKRPGGEIVSYRTKSQVFYHPAEADQT